jgi:hypothetical protein
MALTHRILKKVLRPWGWEARVEVLNGDQVLEGVTPTFNRDPTTQEIDEAMISIKDRIQVRLDYEAVRLKVFDDMGPEIKEAVFWLIRKIRENPNATYAQGETAWNAAWGDSLFTFAKLTAYVQRMAGGITWNQFKTYVINHKFEGID